MSKTHGTFLHRLHELYAEFPDESAKFEDEAIDAISRLGEIESAAQEMFRAERSTFDRYSEACGKFLDLFDHLRDKPV